MSERPRNLGEGDAGGGLRARWWQSADGIALLYLAVSVLWILGSDRLVEMVFGQGHEATLAQSAKGLAWITGTAVVLYLMIRSGERAQRREGRRASESESLLREMGEHVNDVFWITESDPERVLYVSPAFERLWGRRIEEILEHPRLWVDCIHPEDRPAVGAAYDAMLSGGGAKTYDAEYRVRRPDGSVVWIRDRGYPVVDDRGRVVRVVGLAEDVTERREAQRRLRDRDQLLQKLSVQVPGVIYQYRQYPDGRKCFPYASEGIREVYEVTPEQVRESADDVFAVLHPDDLDMIVESIVRSETTMEPWRCEYRVDLPRRGLRWLEGHSVPERLADGSVLWHGYIRDVTDRHASDDALRRSEHALKSANERLEAILNNAPSVAIQGYEPDGSVAFWNSASEALYGWSAADIVGQTLGGRLLSSADAEEFHRIIDHAIESGQPAAVREWRTTNASGQARWCLSSIFPIRFGDGRSQVVCMDVDITSRREIEAALRESEQRFRQLTESIKEAFWLTDWSARRVLYISPAYEAIWGRTTSSLYAQARSWADVLHPEDRDRVLKAFERDSPRGTYDIQYRIVRDDGKVRWIHDRAFPIFNDRGEVWRIAGVSEDITERKLAEERQALMMQELDHRVKNNLAAALSLADMTARHASSLQEFQEVFNGRLAALARMHALLAQTRWHGVRMEELVRRTLEPFLGLSEGRVVMHGQDAMLSAHAASPMCMALHELTTNAVKHGALGTAGGVVDVRWEFEGAVEEPRLLRLTWTEREGPRVSVPERTGFGSTLIRGAIEYQLDGKVDMRYEPEGLVCRIEVDFTRTSEAAERWPRASADGLASGGMRATP